MPPPATAPLLVVSVHDVAPATHRAARDWVRALEGTGVPLSLLVVPGPWRGPALADAGDGDELAAWLRGRRDVGDEICLHGWLHRADVRGALPRRAVGTSVARGAAELWALDRQTAAVRARRGLAALQRHGLGVVGTTPPGWLSSRSARTGLADAGLQYVTDHAGLLDLVSGHRWWAPALCHRPATVPPRRAGLALEHLGRRVVTGAARVVAAGRSVRIGLHPDDLERPGLRAATVEAVRQCVTEGATATTYADILTRLRAEG